MSTSEAVSMHEAHCTFRPRGATIRAVQGVSFNVPAGSCLSLLGPSGCGKTTILRMLAGLERPEVGVISIGRRVVDDPRRRIHVQTSDRHIGMVFQSYAVWPHMSVFSNVAYPLRSTGIDRTETRARVEAMLELVGLEGLERRRATALSGGQQQRVALARALVARPQVLLMDEPLSNLDAQLRTQMQDEVRSLQRALGITMIYVTHDQQEALALSDQVLLMDQGRLVQYGSPQELYDRPRTRFAASFLGNANLLEVLDRPMATGAGTIVTTAIGRVTMSARSQADGQDDDLLAMIRPEVVKVLPLNERRSSAGPAPNCFRASIADVTYRGDVVDIRLKIEGHLLAARTAPGKVPQPGTEAEVYIDPACVRLVRDDGSST